MILPCPCPLAMRDHLHFPMTKAIELSAKWLHVICGSLSATSSVSPSIYDTTFSHPLIGHWTGISCDPNTLRPCTYPGKRITP